ncbi:MAG TPA: MBL fold metallo-hydrolase [Rubrivivax sp.]|nr:MBL fold metallo-hydrolase [Burkholderiales bacterium]HNT40586.1 MBL fold metallo-hydrolase [Rubrivivax sp.]
MKPWLQDLGGGVHAIDTAFVRDAFDAAYLLVRRGRAAYVDTGTRFALPRLLGALDELGLSRDAVEWVIPTHVHLDHAGAVGALVAELPQARVLVHPRGARHMIDPSALWQGALAVYGAEEMARSYGELTPVAAERVVSSSDGMQLELGGSTLRLIDTPGHARHHHCIWDEDTRGWFSGDTFGISFDEFTTARGRWIFPTTTPVQFEPEALRASIGRMLAAAPACMYLTHFGRVHEVERLSVLLLGLLDRIVTLGESLRGETDRMPRLREGLRTIFLESLAAHGCTLSAEQVVRLLEVDLELNAQGIQAWLDRDQRARG